MSRNRDRVVHPDAKLESQGKSKTSCDFEDAVRKKKSKGPSSAAEALLGRNLGEFKKGLQGGSISHAAQNKSLQAKCEAMQDGPAAKKARTDEPTSKEGSQEDFAEKMKAAIMQLKGRKAEKSQDSKEASK
eukprot:gnl/MRDRNA2_/MRDRNA2_28086_c0_seq1.p1 gnl/MRDRNA2_/MRDRNA2_28086_c0~~gnl/MRDRNA2_/MRDRNA2_28086_c0_seq1.p1  ORF type:complete len:131 (+),score=46.61 gnl/MRDRNA2_/MRDRNA2_28086_c0_seq1:81-473(+)